VNPVKRLDIALFFLTGLQMFLALAADAADLPFDTYTGNFVSNQLEPNAANSFVVMTDRVQFDKVFGVAMVMWDNSRHLPKDAFKSNMFVVAIKRGSTVWQYKVEDATVDGGVMQVRYTSKVKRCASATLTVACLLIVSIPKGDYKAVEFIENNKSVKKVEIRKK
jgi:hypothetical protein